MCFAYEESVLLCAGIRSIPPPTSRASISTAPLLHVSACTTAAPRPYESLSAKNRTTLLGQTVIDLDLFEVFMRQNIPEGDMSSEAQRSWKSD